MQDAVPEGSVPAVRHEQGSRHRAPHGSSSQSCISGRRTRLLAPPGGRSRLSLMRETSVGPPGSSLLVSRTTRHVIGLKCVVRGFPFGRPGRRRSSQASRAPSATNQQSRPRPGGGWWRSNSAAMWSAWSTSAPARATVRVLAGGPRQGALSKRVGRAEHVARLHNLSADVLIANMAAPVRQQQSEGRASDGRFSGGAATRQMSRRARRRCEQAPIVGSQRTLWDASVTRSRPWQSARPPVSTLGRPSSPQQWPASELRGS